MLALLVSAYRNQNSSLRRRDSMHLKKPKRGIRDRALYSSYRRGDGLEGVVME